MDDDLNIAAALSALFKLVRVLNSVFIEKRITPKEFQEIDEVLRKTNTVLEIFDFPDRELPSEVRDMLDQREQARQRKEFTEADRIRDQICARGYRITDLKDKTLCTSCRIKDASCPE